jgi:DNA-binding CsgD family transcriptional regulator
MRLSNRELTKLVVLLRDIYAEKDGNSLRRKIVQSLPSLVSAELTHYNEFRRSDNSDVYTVRFPSDVIDPRTVGIFYKYVHEHPVGRANRDLGRIDALKCSDFLTQAQYERTPIYNEYYRLYGFRFQIGFFIDNGAGPRRGFGMLRMSRDFSERERTILNLVRPHIAQACANVGAVDRLRSMNSRLEEAHARFQQALLVLDRNERVVGYTRAAAGWIESFLGATITEDGPAPDAIVQWKRRQNISLPSQLHEPLQLRAQQGELMIRIVTQSEETDSLLLTYTPKESSQSAVLFPKLTPRENEVLHWIAQAKSNPEIACILGISVGTVYRHVENVFSKLGINNRASAMLLALEAEAQVNTSSWGLRAKSSNA